MTWKRSLPALLGLILLAASLAVGAASTAGANAGNAGNDLTGAWEATIDLPEPQVDLKSLQVFSPEGGFVEMSNEPQASRTAQYGSWERIGGRLYAATGLIFRFNPAGVHVATVKINRTIRLSEDGQSMSWFARVTVTDLAGNVLQAFPVQAGATRLPVERIPDQP